MTADEIRRFIERYVVLWERADLRSLVECYTDTAQIESPIFHSVKGRANIEKSFSDLFRAFDDWDMRVDDIIIDRGPEERAVLAFSSFMTHRGEIFGVPGTGRKVENSGVFILRFEDGRIALDRRLYDFTGFLVQLGVLKARAV